MWMILGVAAIVFAILGLVFSPESIKGKWFRFGSLSFTAFTVCAFYSDAASRVIREDWDGLMDIMPTTGKALWVCVILSVIVNSVSLFRESRNSKKTDQSDK